MALAPLSVTSPPQAVTAGTSNVPAGLINITAQVNQGYNNYLCGVDTSTYPVSDVIHIQINFTQDNGATFISGGAVDTVGGLHTDRLGNPVFPSVDGPLPAVGVNGLQVQFVVTVPSAGTLQGRATLSQVS